MPFSRSFCRAVPAVGLFLALATAQTCYYPDGKTESNDTPCPSTGDQASCCPSAAICLDNGLCYSAGIVSRSSCTDATWGSPACAGYCKTVNTSGTVALTPCSSDGGTNIFTCGFGGSDCSKDSDTFTMAGAAGLSLRTNQVAQLLSAALPSSTDGGLAATVTAYVTATAAPSADGSFTSGQVAGLAIGIAIPLIAGLLAFFALWRREKRLNAPPKLMYKLPDDLKDEFTWRPPPSTRSESPSFGISIGPRSAGSTTPASSSFADRQNSFRSFASPKPDHMQNFQERYDAMRSKTSLPERHELAVKVVDIPRQELGPGRRSRQ